MLLGALAAIVFAATLVGLALIFGAGAGARRAIGAGSAAIAARTRVDTLSLVLLALGFIDIYLALPQGHPPVDVPAFVHVATLPLAYIAIAIGAAMRVAAARGA